MVRYSSCVTVCVSLALLTPALSAQSSAPAPKLYPYHFSNFVWWSDANLRLALKHKLPGLGDTLLPFGSREGQVRLALIELLKTKGVHADVQVFDPPEHATPPVDSIAMGLRAAKMILPGFPKPTIAFTIAAPPEILVGDVSVDGAPPELQTSIQPIAQGLSGSPFASASMISFRLHSLFQSSAYLSATTTLLAGTPARTSPDHYVVPCTLKIDPGPAYHIGSISIDPGPLFAGADLSNYILEQPGDLVVPHMLNRLVTTLKDTYRRAGYAYVDVTDDPVLDQPKSLANYNVRVDPGPIYHLRHLTILNLDPDREQIVRDLVNLKSGDLYDSLSLADVFPKLRSNPLFAGYTSSYSPREDENNHLVDLTITFYVPHQ